ncbi:MAG TPA: metallophosphoesterase [Tepidisphaeraceae bacterium]|jgi:predicted MPP superfamily phosphohydrolase|nr:metallophosphoesterase [Tepidisphaeraceae bacterium]
MIFLAIIFALLIADALWWRWADRMLRTAPHAKVWRSILAVFMSVLLLYLLMFLIAPGYGRRSYTFLPQPMLAMIYLWHLLVMPGVAIIAGVGAMGQRITRIVRYLSRGRKPAVAQPPAFAGGAEQEIGNPSRREILAASIVAVPPLVSVGLTVRAMSELDDLRLRRMDLKLPNLPANLEGMTIAHVSDTHIGRFTRKGSLARVIEMTNQLRADLVLFTGDLIDISLADLPRGIEMLQEIDPRSGLFVIEGNHDLIDDKTVFERTMKATGIPTLLNESVTAIVRGEPIQLLGTRWTHGDNTIRQLTESLRPAPGAFSILLAHHPHAFDYTTADLTLAGHTHGGQIMFNERLGFGPAMFRYWSGLYEKAGRSLVVSNGTGNWFPLRVHAPAEIVHLTLHRG